MCHTECPCILCSYILLIVCHLSGVSPLKFNQQSLHVRNAKGSLVAKIPVEGIAPGRDSTTLPGKDENPTLVWYKGDGCNLTELTKAAVPMQKTGDIKSMVVLTTLNCDLATKIAHSHLSQISIVLFHNLATNDKPSGIVLEASDIISKDHPLPVYFIGYKHGHLLLDKFMTPYQFYFTVNPVKEELFVTTDPNLLNGKANRHKLPRNTQNQKTRPGFTSSTFASIIYSETEFESFLESHFDFPPMAAFFGGMILWILQAGLLFGLMFVASFLIISILFGLRYYYPFKLFGREDTRRSPSPEIDEISDEFDEHLLSRLMQMYELMNPDEEFATVRLTEEKIASLLKTILDESDATQLGVCGICEEVYQAGVEVTKLLPSCSHLFHTICIEPWLRMASSCPLCRRIVTGRLGSAEDSEMDTEYETAE